MSEFRSSGPFRVQGSGVSSLEVPAHLGFVVWVSRVHVGLRVCGFWVPQERGSSLR